ncbi:MAG: YihY/virulence factor BrkB family protein [Chloroflexota bacterium]|nr:MAG: YihY/virulence factor BrkB family protein [Chloroflexota bacterium]
MRDLRITKEILLSFERKKGWLQGWLHELNQSVSSLLGKIYQLANRLSFGALDIIRDALHTFIEARGAEAAASLAFYALFSLFPLLLSLVAIGGFFLESAVIQEYVLGFIRLAIPVSTDLILGNITQVLLQRERFGILGAIGLIWSASAAFITLFRNINRAWMQAKPLSALRSRLTALATVIVLGILLVLALFANAVVNFLPRLNLPLGFGASTFETPLWEVVASAGSILGLFVLFLFLYRWIPNTSVRWSEAFWAALVAAFGVEFSTDLFTWAVSSGLAQYRLIYGSLGTIVTLLFWIYLVSLIAIFGAYLSASIAQHTRDTAVPAPTPLDEEGE